MVPDLVVIGRVVKAHGLRGEVAVDVLSDVPGRFDAGSSVRLDGRATTIVSSRPHQGRMLVRFEGHGDRSAAELLRGMMVEAPAVDVSDSETYFAHELVGMAVVDESGADLGSVSALIELPDAAGYDLLEVVRSDGSTWLLPAADDVVEVEQLPDGASRLRLVDPPEGLVDPAEADAAGDEGSDVEPGPSDGAG